VARIRLPDPNDAPALRQSLEDSAEFVVDDIGHAEVDVRPAEGAGATRALLQAHRLCDRGTQITAATWAPLAAHPGYEANPGARERLLREADRLGRIGSPEAMLESVASAVAGLRNDELPLWLDANVGALFQHFPGGSLWLVSVDPVLLARLTMLGGFFALDVTPDFPLNPRNHIGFNALDEHSLTRGVAFAKTIDPVLLAFSPGTVGFSFDRQPHGLVLLFGDTYELRRKPPRSLSALYEPRALEVVGVPWDDPRFLGNLPAGDIESLLQWWVSRLNVFYSHAADPTRFVDGNSAHDAIAQTAWFLTFERLLADATLILGSPQLAALARLGTAFDFLDKAEGLLGYGRNNTGAGFKKLLEKTSMTDRLRQAWDVSLPLRLRARFQRHAEELFESTYAEIHDHALSFRRTAAGVKVGRSSDDTTPERPLEEYVPDLVRATRNSSHGFLDALREKHRFLLATHDGHMPLQLADLAAFLLFGLAADADAVCNGQFV
jgi:hypothetical protein